MLKYKKLQEELGRKEKTDKSVSLKSKVIAFGRMNPPTVGHEQVVNKVRSVAKEHGAAHAVILSHSHDPKKNPLSPEQKVTHARNAFPGTTINAASKEHPTILHHAAQAHAAGVKHLHVVAGSDRHQAMHDLLHKYNGQHGAHGHYNFKSITMHSSGERDPDSEGTSGISGSKMREHAASGNKEAFHAGAPSGMKPKHKDAMYNDVRKGMNLKEETVQETLRPEMGASHYIDDFIKSTNPRFNNKSKEERRRMAIGAYMAAKARGVKESIDESRSEHARTILHHTQNINIEGDHPEGKLSGGALHYTLSSKSPTFKKLSDKHYGDYHHMVKHASDEDLKQMHNDFTKKVNEEAEQIDEISAKLAGNYYGAATKKHLDKVGVKPDMYGRIEKDMGKNRKVGVDRALDRVMGNRKTNEEIEMIDELSTDLLARYKTASAASAKTADAAGNYAKGDKRFKGINKATTKQFDNDLKKHGQMKEGTLQGNIGGGDAMNTTTSAPSASTSKDTTMGKRIKGFKFFNGENDKQMNMNQPVKEEKKEDPPFDGPYKSTFKKPNNPSRTGMDSARSLAQRAMDQVKKKPVQDLARARKVNMGESKDPHEYGYEGEMTMNQLKTLVRCAEMIEDCLKPDTDLPEWVQSKITLATDYIQTAADYLYSESEVKEGYRSYSGRSHGHAYGGGGFGKREREDDEYHVPDPTPVAPTVARKYIKGTPENKAAKAASKPINGHPTNEEVEQIDELSINTLNRVHGAAVRDANDASREGDEEKANKRYNLAGKASNKAETKYREAGLKPSGQHSMKEEVLDEKSDQARRNKTMKNMLDTIRGAKFKLNNPVPDTDHKTAQEKNKAIGRALRNESMTGNPGKGYHGACGTADEKYEEMHKHVKNLTDGDDKTVKHYLDSGHGEKLAGREEDHDHIKSDFNKFMKYYRPEMNDPKPAVKEETAPVGKPQKIALKTAVIKLHPKGVASDTEEGWAKPKIKEGTMKSYKDFLQSLDEASKKKPAWLLAAELKAEKREGKLKEESTDHKAEYEHHMNKHIEHAESGDWDKAEEHAEKAEDAATKHFKATGKKIYDPGYTGGHEHITSSQHEQKIDEIKMADVPSRMIKGKSYGADYEDPEGAFETKKDMKKPEKAGRKAGAGAGVYKPRATMSKLKSAGATYK